MADSANISREGARGGPGLDPLAPVVVVGQARSGSSLVTLILNRHANGLVINDAYAAQMADEIGLGPAGDPARDPARLARFRAAALARIAARSALGGEAPIHRPSVITPAMRAALTAARGEDWATLWGAMLHGAAAAGGRAFWGWNTPPDHARAAEILAAFPRARFLFVMRDPWAVLRSFKALPAHWGRERARWHPALQARAWAAAARAARRLARERPGQIAALRYETLVTAPEAARADLARFLGVAVAPFAPAALPRNGSDRAARLGRAEILAARLALAGEDAAMGFAPPEADGLGLGALARATVRAGIYYAAEAARSRDMRRRIARMARA